MIPNLGFAHIAVIVIVGLIVFGPNKLPEMLRKFGKAWRMVQLEAEKANATLRSAIDTDTDAPAISTKVVHDTPDEMAIQKEAEVAQKKKPHAPKPRKSPAKKTTSAARKKSAPAKKTAAKKPKVATPSTAYPINEDT
ncbi:MAG: Sec-independent protein translocase subunit TatA/TatB [Actinomycetota bacterium]